MLDDDKSIYLEKEQFSFRFVLFFIDSLDNCMVEDEKEEDPYSQMVLDGTMMMLVNSLA